MLVGLRGGRRSRGRPGSPRAGSGRGPGAGRRQASRRASSGMVAGCSNDRSTTARARPRAAALATRARQAVVVRTRSRHHPATARRRASARGAARAGESSSYGGASSRQQPAVRRGAADHHRRVRRRGPASAALLAAADPVASAGRRRGAAGSRSGCRAAGCRAARCPTRRGRSARSWSPYERSSATIWLPAVRDLRSEVLEHDRLRLLVHARSGSRTAGTGSPRSISRSRPRRVVAGQGAQLLVEAELLAVVARRSRGRSARPCRAYGAVRGRAAGGRPWRSRWGAGTARCRRRAGRGPR